MIDNKIRKENTDVISIGTQERQDIGTQETHSLDETSPQEVELYNIQIAMQTRLGEQIAILKYNDKNIKRSFDSTWIFVEKEKKLHLLPNLEYF